MKNSTPFKLLVLSFCFFFVIAANAQVTITSDDFTTKLDLGDTIATYLDTTITQLNVGDAGENTWDLTALVANESFVTESKDLASSPYSSEFPAAQYASNYSGTFAGVFSNSWVYSSVESDKFLTHGTGTLANTAAGESTAIIKYNPAWTQYNLPLNYGDMHSFSGEQKVSTKINVPGFGDVVTDITQAVTIRQNVNGYGNFTLPGGKTCEGLRIVEVSTYEHEGITTTSTVIRLLAKTGETVQITPVNQTDTIGSVAVANVSWTSGSATSETAESPNAPSALSSTVSSDMVELMWTDNSDDESGFYIERAEGKDSTKSLNAAGDFVLIDSVAENSSSYTDMSIMPGMDYSYRIRAYNEMGVSAYSEVISVTTMPESVLAPTNLVATVNDTIIDLTWADAADNETGFYIERTSDGMEYELIDSVMADVMAYYDSTVMAGIEYTYRVAAYNGSMVSEYSNTAIVEIITTSIQMDGLFVDDYSLEQNYPNPFTNTTTISFRIPGTENVELVVYGSDGRMLRKLIQSKMLPGDHTVDFNANGLKSGMYFYQLRTSSFTQTKQMLVR